MVKAYAKSDVGKAREINQDSYYMNLPTIVLIMGFVLTYTVYAPGIYVCCLISIVMWIVIGRLLREANNGN